ncbi:phage head morphogenesis protein [Stutzerimonas nitrititolerans]|uniref:Phage head morphogenesis protein n=1 Tax=Stutzerimonas nitrititolerans TaxID=2482751 RepID=A0AA41WN91_9GAMM|nr:phage head morphogenesis protein [Stutzerimonas nitrititolerans]MCO7546169.1 phage head morphogenesis protein [Stutzerimonas nitrititolerans]
MNAAEILTHIEALEPGLHRAYLDSVRSTVDSATVAEVERLIADENEAALVDLLSLGALALLAEGIRAAFLAGGRREMAAIVIPRQLRQEIGRPEFDISLPPAQAWLSEQSRSVRQEAAESVREAIASVLASRRASAGPARTARQAALDLVGRVSPQTGQRSGGVLGLPGNMAQYVANARRQLLSGDPEQLKQYLQRVRRDRRFDSIARRAIETGIPIESKNADKIVGRYAERLLATHAEMLARTAAAESFSAGRDRAWEQLVEQGLDRSRIEKEWRDRADEKVRNSHRHMRGQRALLGQPFRTNSGELLLYPGDSSLGAGMDEIANCRCICIYHLKA